MTGEEMERAIEFLLNQQANLQNESMRLQQEAEEDRRQTRQTIVQIAEQANTDRQVIVRAVDEIRTAITTFSQNILELNSNLTDHVIDLERRVGRLENNRN